MEGNYILSFIGFMPADNPQIVVYVAVDNPKGVTQYGGTVSAPIAKNIMKSAIDILEIKPSLKGMPKEYTWLDEKYVQMPDVLNKDIKDAKKLLKGFKIEYTGSGNKVIHQSPDKDMYIKENGTVLLLLGE